LRAAFPASTPTSTPPPPKGRLGPAS